MEQKDKVLSEKKEEEESKVNEIVKDDPKTVEDGYKDG